MSALIGAGSETTAVLLVGATWYLHLPPHKVSLEEVLAERGPRQLRLRRPDYARECGQVRNTASRSSRRLSVSIRRPWWASPDSRPRAAIPCRGISFSGL